MADPTRLGDYRAALEELLAGAEAELTEGELAALRTVVRERRNRRGGRPATECAEHVHEHVSRIVELLGAAARQLRPRETQELDDLVAGIRPAPELPARPPVRVRRYGRLS